MKITTNDFEFIRDLAEKKAGIRIQPGKEYLVENRLKALLKEHDFTSLKQYVELLRNNLNDGELVNKTIDALTINETSFFRDHHPFEHLKHSIIPKIVEANKNTRTLSIWSSACSTGQEIYSIAILLEEHFKELKSWNIKLVATDISDTVLKRARLGTYTQFEANRGLSHEIKNKYFRPNGDSLEIIDSIKNLVEFKPINFMDHWNFPQKFDIILMRNVLIYFDLETKRKVLEKTKSYLSPNGHLLLGSSETTYNIDPQWNSIRSEESTSYQLEKTPKPILTR